MEQGGATGHGEKNVIENMLRRKVLMAPKWLARSNSSEPLI